MPRDLRPVEPAGDMPTQFLENNFVDLVSRHNHHSVLGAMLIAEHLQGVYPDSPEIAEVLRSTNILETNKESFGNPLPFPGGQREPAVQQASRAEALHAFVWHKVRTREDYSAHEVAKDFRGVFKSMTPLNYGFLRESVLAPKRLEMVEAGNLTPKQDVALHISERVAEQYTFRPGRLVKALRQAISSR